MKKALLVALVAVFVFAFASAAFAGAATPSNVSATGDAVFTYQDLMDAVCQDPGRLRCLRRRLRRRPVLERHRPRRRHRWRGNGYATNPHGGYSASSNKCKVCHAVHRADGAYYLLRGDSQSDSCDYCHIGGSAHSDLIVYDLNPAGTATTNGHTMGAGQVPDSSISQTATPVTISGSDIDGNTVSETIEVRSYDPQEIAMYRFSRHHSQSPQGTGRSGWKPVGPNSLSCFSCHQPHNAPSQVWRPRSFDPAVTADGAFLTTGYKLLRRFPSGDWYGLQDASHGTAVGQAPGVNTYGMVDAGLAIKVPESTLTAGVNYSTDFSNSRTYTENGYTGRTPGWIAQNISLRVRRYRSCRGSRRRSTSTRCPSGVLTATTSTSVEPKCSPTRSSASRLTPSVPTRLRSSVATVDLASATPATATTSRSCRVASTRPVTA